MSESLKRKRKYIFLFFRKRVIWWEHRGIRRRFYSLVFLSLLCSFLNLFVKFSCNQFKIHKKAKQTLKSETKKPDLNNEKLGLTSTEPLKKPLKLERQDRIKKGIRGRMWPGRGNSFDACDLSLVNQQSERTETLMRGFNTGIGTAAADADVIWQLNQLQEHLPGLFGALMGRKLQSHSDLESYLRGVKMLNSYRHDSRIWGK